MIGGFLHRAGQIGRESAQVFSAARSVLAGAADCGRLLRVVVVRPARTRTGSLHRYPSPVGRSALPPGAPPAFFSSAPAMLRDRRRVAHFRGELGEALIFRPYLPCLRQGFAQQEEGTEECSSPNGSRARHAHWLCRDAVTRRSSRGLSARVRGRQRPLSWMATRLPAPSSAVRPTCFTAVNTRHAADRVAGSGLRASDTVGMNWNHLARTWPGGFLLSEEPFPVGRCACGQDQEGT